VLAVWQKPNFSTGGSFSSKFQKYISKWNLRNIATFMVLMSLGYNKKTSACTFDL
jgi:hypothetical protein